MPINVPLPVCNLPNEKQASPVEAFLFFQGSYPKSVEKRVTAGQRQFHTSRHQLPNRCYFYTMSSDLVIVRATKEDIPALNRLVNSAYRGDSSRKGWTTEADLLDGIRTDPEALEDMMEQPGAVILKCTDKKGVLQGCVFLKKTEAQLYLGMLTVWPELQGSGIGKKLLEASEAYAREQGCTKIVMTVISVRSELIAWYERKGFRTTGEKSPFPKDPRFGIPKQDLEFVVMEKETG